VEPFPVAIVVNFNICAPNEKDLFIGFLSMYFFVQRWKWFWNQIIFLIDEVPFYAAADERIVELQGEAMKVLKALEAVVGHLRKFLV